jgi:hypothetical protein
MLNVIVNKLNQLLQTTEQIEASGLKYPYLLSVTLLPKEFLSETSLEKSDVNENLCFELNNAFRQRNADLFVLPTSDGLDVSVFLLTDLKLMLSGTYCEVYDAMITSTSFETASRLIRRFAPSELHETELKRLYEGVGDE